MNSSSIVTKQLPCGNLQQEFYLRVYGKMFFQAKQYPVR